MKSSLKFRSGLLAITSTVMLAIGWASPAKADVSHTITLQNQTSYDTPGDSYTTVNDGGTVWEYDTNPNPFTIYVQTILTVDCSTGAVTWTKGFTLNSSSFHTDTGSISPVSTGYYDVQSYYNIYGNYTNLINAGIAGPFYNVNISGTMYYQDTDFLTFEFDFQFDPDRNSNHTDLEIANWGIIIYGM